jgi:hypothetical protein
VALDERPRIARIALPVQHAGGAGIGLAVLFDLLARRQPNHSVAGEAGCALIGGVEIVGVQFRVMVRHAAEQRDAPDGIEIARRLAGGEPVRDLDDGALGVAVEQQIRLGVGQHRAAHLLGPVVEMRDAT